jgi:hypothetical protein
MKNLKTYNNWLFESYYDSISSQLTDRIITQWVKDWKSKKTEFRFYETIEDRIEFDIECVMTIDPRIETFECLDSTGANADDEDEEGDYQTPYILIDFGVNPNALPSYWQEIYMYVLDTVRHEIEHITQGGSTNYKKGKPSDDDSKMRELIDKGKLPMHTYWLLPKEIDANLQGLRLKSKKTRIPYIETIMNYLRSEGVTDPVIVDEIITKWRERAKKIGGIYNF